MLYHDLLRELCITKGKEDNFFGKNYNDGSITTVTNKHRRLFIDSRLFNSCLSSCSGNLCSFIYPEFFRGLDLDERELSFFAERFKLLRVLHLMSCYTTIGELRRGDLVHLRYLALQVHDTDNFLKIFCNLSNLEILELDLFPDILVPPHVLKMVKLRKLFSFFGTYMFHHNYEDEGKKNMLESLQILHSICGCKYCLHFLKRAPNLRNLSIRSGVSNCNLSLYDLEFLKCLEELYFYGHLRNIRTVELKLPPTITRLDLMSVELNWKQLSILLQTLPRLEVLILYDKPSGKFWNTSELDEGFSQLKYLKLSKLDIEEWSASEYHFPRLEVLVIDRCKSLQGIPIEFVNSYELREIKVEYSTVSAEQSARKIQEEQKKYKRRGCLPKSRC